ncbi:MAG: hypothetical protein WCL00_11225, partial [Bacteroidota bacterium]
AIIITYVFFTAASTKMTSFCLIVAPFGFLAIGALTEGGLQGMNKIIKWTWLKTVFSIIAVCVVCFFLLNFSNIQNYHTDWKPWDNCNRPAYATEMKMISRIKEEIPNSGYVIFNARARVYGHVPVMFYTDNIAYGCLPDTNLVIRVKKMGFKVAVVDLGDLPDFIKSDSTIKKIRVQP